MTNFLIVIVAVVFLLFMWIVTYKNILNHSIREVAQAGEEIEEGFLKMHDVLPYLLEVLKEHKEFDKCNGAEIMSMRSKIIETGAKINSKYKAYSSGYTYLEEIFAMSDRKVKSDTGFLEARKELQNIHDGIRLALKVYNKNANEYNRRLIKFPGNFVGSLFRLSSLREL